MSRITEIRLSLFLPWLVPSFYFFFFSSYSGHLAHTTLLPTILPPPSNMDPGNVFPFRALSRSRFVVRRSSLVHESPRNQREALATLFSLDPIVDFGFWSRRGWKFRVQGLAATLCLESLGGWTCARLDVRETDGETDGNVFFIETEMDVKI